MNKMILKEDLNIENMIYEIRGCEVILDSALSIFINMQMVLKQLIKLLRIIISNVKTCLSLVEVLFHL